MIWRFLLITLLTAVIFSGCSKKETQSYIHPNPPFRIEFPENWEVRNGVAGTTVIAVSPAENGADPFRENINVVAEDISEKPDAEDYFIQSRSNLEYYLTDFQLISESETPHGSLPARFIEFRSRTGSVSSHYLMLMVADGKTGYIVTAAADPGSFEQYRPIFEKTLRSFQPPQKAL